jgi:hypothetical protein
MMNGLGSLRPSTVVARVGIGVGDPGYVAQKTLVSKQQLDQPVRLPKPR